MRRPLPRFGVLFGLCGLGLAAACSVAPDTDSVQTRTQRVVTLPPSVGAADSGTYRNLFDEWLGATEGEVDSKVNVLWDHYFGGGSTSTLYNADGSNGNGPKAYIYDTGNRDVRSEGMSYGMMIALQLDKKAEFDALWNWAKTNMQHQGNEYDGYFAWQCSKRGRVMSDSPASDGEEYFATALFFASHRWGDGSGIYNYSEEANRILDTMLHKEDMNGGVVGGVTNMFDTTYKQVVFTPYISSAEHTDPSYHLPAFYELWARWADGYSASGGEATDLERSADRQFWLDAAQASRTFFGLTTHPVTGLNPDYAFFTGEPHPDYQGNTDHMDFRYDAWRTSMNWAVDYSWWAADNNETILSDRLLTFFYNQGLSDYGNLFTLDGTELGDDHSLGLVATNAAAALAASDSPDAHAQDFVQALWDAEPQYGNYRYYDGLLQFMSFLHVAGRFQIYFPEATCASSELLCTGGQDEDCDGLIDCADPDCDVNAACDTCGNGICGASENACSCAGDCGAAPAAESLCTDGMDDDCDELVDCADPDCSTDPACEVCGNGTCGANEDICSCAADCGSPPAEDCGNGSDDDCDGLIDCGDTDCSSEPACQIPGGQLSLAPIFSTGMVLQQGTLAPVFGQAAPGANVTVEFQGQIGSGAADENGDFIVLLPALSASSTPAVLSVSSGPDVVTVSDVQVGEVWLCSGQSNMGRSLSSADNSSPYIADAGNHNLRFFSMHNDELPATTSWEASDSTTAADFSAVCYWMGLDLSQRLGVPIGLIQASFDGSPIEDWKHSDGSSGVHYDTMLRPILPFALQGVLWYQGESNGGEIDYEPKLLDLLAEWRADWGDPSLPFGIVQLPATKWKASRLAQYNVAQADPRAFLVVTHDLPGGSKLHPTAKYEVGIRSSIGARATVYGEAIEAGGPSPLSSSVSGGSFIIDYSSVGSALSTNNGGAPGPFQVAGSNGRFVSASASIVGNTIVVSSSRVSAPLSVRYSYTGVGNVTNTVNIPVEGGNTVTSIPGSLYIFP